MNYIYDILLNFNDTFYDFYDWNENDNIMHIRKIPIIRISSNDFFKMKNNTLKLDEDFINRLQNKTEIFKSRKVEILKTAFLITDGIDVLGLYFNNKQMYSDLLIDEKDEVLDMALKLDEEKVSFDIVKPLNKNEYMTRYDQKIIKYLYQELKRMEKNKDTNKIKYLYYECFNKKCDNYLEALKLLKQKLNLETNDFYLKLYNFFKVTALKK